MASEQAATVSGDSGRRALNGHHLWPILDQIAENATTWGKTLEILETNLDISTHLVCN
jgi:hypothetical protein